jgi:hypothetical protein
VAVLLDERLICVSTLRAGFDAQAETTTGLHEIQLRTGVDKNTFVVDLPGPGTYLAELYYSWFFGEFRPGNSEE